MNTSKFLILMQSFYKMAGVSVSTQRRVIPLAFMGMNKLPLNSELKLFPAGTCIKIM